MSESLVIFNKELGKYGYRFQSDWITTIKRDTSALFGDREVQATLAENTSHVIAERFTVLISIRWRKGLTFTAEAKGQDLGQTWTDAMAIAIRVIGQMATKV